MADPLAIEGVVKDANGKRKPRVTCPGRKELANALSDLGVKLSLVQRQCDPDGGRFSTVETANPEQPDALPRRDPKAHASQGRIFGSGVVKGQIADLDGGGRRGGHGSRAAKVYREASLTPMARR